MNTEKTYLIPEKKEDFDEMFLTGVGFYNSDIKPNTNFENE